jgi:hypothetical protein
MSLRLLSDTIPKIAGKVCGGRKYTMLGRVVTRWADIIGADMAGKTQATALKYRSKKGQEPEFTLEIAASSADATLLQYRIGLILERINQIFGERMITAIRFVPIPVNSNRKAPLKRKIPLTEAEKNSLYGMLAGVDDPELAERLQSLGLALLQDKKS